MKPMQGMRIETFFFTLLRRYSIQINKTKYKNLGGKDKSRFNDVFREKFLRFRLMNF